MDAGGPRFKPSTVSRRFSVAAGFYRTCVIDGLMEHSPAEHVWRPSVPTESPTLGFTHLQFEALLTTARGSQDPCDFALAAMPGLLGLRIFEATGADIADLGDEHGHRVLRVCGKGTKIVLIPLPPAVGRAMNRATGTRMSRPILLIAAAPRWRLGGQSCGVRHRPRAIVPVRRRAHADVRTSRTPHTYYARLRAWVKSKTKLSGTREQTRIFLVSLQVALRRDMEEIES